MAELNQEWNNELKKEQISLNSCYFFEMEARLSPKKECAAVSIAAGQRSVNGDIARLRIWAQ